MAPEIVRRRPTDQRLDIFAYGASMYEMFAFELPWQRGSDGLAAMSHGYVTSPPLSQYCPTINPSLEGLIMSCIEGDPEKRPPSMDAVIKQLRQVKTEEK